MDISVSHTRIRLDAHESISVIDGNGSRIACRDGKVWITQEQDARDILLGAGDAFTLDRGGLAIVQALGSSEIALDAPGRLTGVRGGNVTSLAVLGFDRRRSAPRIQGQLLTGIHPLNQRTSPGSLAPATLRAPA